MNYNIIFHVNQIMRQNVKQILLPYDGTKSNERAFLNMH